MNLLLAATLAAPPVWWALAPWVAADRFTGAAALLSAALLYPLLEELSFRGLLQGWLLDRLGGWHRYGGISLPNLLTSLAFSGAHLATQPVLWAAAMVVPSLVFGHLRERHGSVLPPMALHIYYNSGLILFVELAQ
ncbi:JDVT-CTERM system glutamic-type intramembrane protease [Ramlibacter sp. WS9]|uniref:JDVT-CTERM system glutamic-type intramembrane protease MrtJ n=1 Tax=Ramlibacter sp. WS9 TaxID=1882741 RepID=UPI0011447AFD|nr:JDVT-CTERM system glutamic-type intramembrane protease [Ramlibacter sp. WS9]ROZ74416.1 JDVT-CTERM system CAAX-type protease [Ramlibacter sp. WS9]